MTINTHRYLLFCYDAYYPEGGWNDFIASSDDIQTLKDNPKVTEYTYVDIIDLAKQDIIISRSGPHAWINYEESSR